MEFITVDELSNRLHVSRATLFIWMQKGILAQGKHYFKHGRVLRFVWGDSLVNELLLGNVKDQDHRPAARTPKARNDSPLNWDY